MEHAEGNRKIVLKVLSTLLIMYILTGVALFVLAFLLWGIIMGAAYFLVLLIGSALLNRGLTSDMLHIGLTLVMCMGAGMIGGMVS